MTERERFVRTLCFQEVDRVPFDPGYGRRSTMEMWHRQGLPEVPDWQAYLHELLGIEPPDRSELPWNGVDFRMIPQFEEKVIERRPATPGSGLRGTLVVQDWKGNICEISDEFDVSYLRNAIDFVTRSWIKCPVEIWGDWEAMKHRYDVAAPGRFAPDFKQRAAGLRNRTRVTGVFISGPFWQMREWLGFENLCMMFHDDPALIEDMVAFWEQFVAGVLEIMLQEFVPDFVMIQEDMAYKEKPMISPAMCRRFLLRTWRRWGEQLRAAGMPVYEVDSDGHVGQLLPVFIEAGFNSNSPMEVAAGNDLPGFRKTYGRALAYRGGIDKRAMAKGGQAIRDEISRLRPVIQSGGFIPSCDHGIPPDVSWPNMVEYSRLLAQATGWL